MYSKEFSGIRRGMDCGIEVGDLIQDLWDSDGPVALYLETQEKRNWRIVHELEKIGAPAELIEDVREGATQNANTVLFLIDEARNAYPEYRMYSAEQAKMMNQILSIIRRVAGPTIAGLIDDMFSDCPWESEVSSKDGKDYREKQGRLQLPPDLP